MVLKSCEEEDALVAQRTAELGGGFWARVKAGARSGADDRRVLCSAVSPRESSWMLLDGRLSRAAEVAPLKELARQCSKGR